MTKDERAFLSDLVGTGCALCRLNGYEGTPAEVHHVRTGVGVGRRSSHWRTIPLCPEHHRGASGFHGLGRRLWEQTYGISELGLMDFARKSLQHCLTLERRVVSYYLPGSDVEPE